MLTLFLLTFKKIFFLLYGNLYVTDIEISAINTTENDNIGHDENATAKDNNFDNYDKHVTLDQEMKTYGILKLKV